MNIFPLISSPVSDLGTELPLAREVRWDFTKDEPVCHGIGMTCLPIITDRICNP